MPAEGLASVVLVSSLMVSEESWVEMRGNKIRLNLVNRTYRYNDIVIL